MDPAQASKLDILFFPLMAPGHMIPMVDLAKLFSSKGVKVTILTTPANKPLIQGTIDRCRNTIEILLVPFNSTAVGLPEGVENLSAITKPELQPRFLQGVAMLRQHFDEVLKERMPDCVVTDSFMPWTYDVSSEIRIPRLVFHGTSFFALSVGEALGPVPSRKNLPGDGDTFVLPGLPHRIEMLKTQIPLMDTSPHWIQVFNQIRESERKSFGMVENSFYELEPDYVEHYRKITGKRIWAVGPVSLCNQDDADKSSRGGTAPVKSEDCLNWLSRRSPRSVIYICFGSLCDFTSAQVHEIALALQSSNYAFIWVLTNPNVEKEPEWLPENFEEKIGDRCLIIRGWAPQILIINHPAVGGFVTHCGWNSTLEAVCAGLPMVTWPLFAEQFYNERLIVDVLKIGVGVGVKEYAIRQYDMEVIKAVEIEVAVDKIMGDGEMAAAIRDTAAGLKEKAKTAVADGGSSYCEMENLIQELLDRKHTVIK